MKLIRSFLTFKFLITTHNYQTSRSVRTCTTDIWNHILPFFVSLQPMRTPFWKLQKQCHNESECKYRVSIHYNDLLSVNEYYKLLFNLLCGIFYVLSIFGTPFQCTIPGNKFMSKNLLRKKSTDSNYYQIPVIHATSRSNRKRQKRFRRFILHFTLL